MEIDHLNREELQALRGRIQDRLRALEQLDIEKARAEIAEIAKRVGIPLAQLISSAKSPQAKRERTIKYRDPSNPSNQWSGGGRRPKWVHDWIDAGKDLKVLLVE